jgi:hypothetical protein
MSHAIKNPLPDEEKEVSLEKIHGPKGKSLQRRVLYPVLGMT